MPKTNVTFDGMKSITYIKSCLVKFTIGESGAVTVDWVVLTAAVVGLVSSIFLTLGNDAADYSRDIGTYMSSQGVKTTY